MVIEESIQEQAKVLQLSGALDFKAREVFNEAITKVRGSGLTCIILDFQRVKFVDSAAIGLLNLAAVSLKKEAIALRMVAPQDNVRKILDLVNIPRAIPIFATIDQAVIG